MLAERCREKQKKGREAEQSESTMQDTYVWGGGGVTAQILSWQRVLSETQNAEMQGTEEPDKIAASDVMYYQVPVLLLPRWYIYHVKAVLGQIQTEVTMGQVLALPM